MCSMLLENLGDYPLSTADGIRFLFGCSLCVCSSALCYIWTVAAQHEDAAVLHACPRSMDNVFCQVMQSW